VAKKYIAEASSKIWGKIHLCMRRIWAFIIMDVKTSRKVLHPFAKKKIQNQGKL
jgi:hypothetical protein